MEWRNAQSKLRIGVATVSLLYVLLLVSSHEFSDKIGINYGLLGNNLPTPSESIKLIQRIHASRVRIYDADAPILSALKGTSLQVSITVPKTLIVSMSSNQSMANEWIRNNVLLYYPHTLIRYILVGNEILSDMDDADKETWFCLVLTMKRIKFALRTYNISTVKVSTSFAMDVLESSYPPSNGTFRSDVAFSVVRPILQFLEKTKSFFFVDPYPYVAWLQNYPNINLDYALINGGANYTDPLSGLTYTNLLDQMLDAIIFAMKRVGFPDVRLWIGETGWPNACDVDQIGGNPHNAAVYNRNLVKKLTTKPPVGTPARPGVIIPAFLFSLYNENQKFGPETERHWGVYYPNGTDVYPIDLSGETPSSDYPAIPEGTNNEPYKGKVWCVVGKGANMTELGPAVSYACSQGNATCDALHPGKECYKPNLLLVHASYAFSSYWAQFRSQGVDCYINGLAVQTTKDPSRGSCKYPSVTLP